MNNHILQHPINKLYYSKSEGFSFVSPENAERMEISEAIEEARDINDLARPGDDPYLLEGKKVILCEVKIQKFLLTNKSY